MVTMAKKSSMRMSGKRGVLMLQNVPNEWKGRTVFYVADAHALGEGSGGYADPFPRDVKIMVKKSTTYAADLVENVFDPCMVPKIPPNNPELKAE